MSQSSVEKLAQVVRRGLCTRCGACVGLSDGAIQIRDRDGSFLPEQVRWLDASLADRIWRGCSAAEVSFPDLNLRVFGSQRRHAFLGHFRRLSIGYCTDPVVRQKCASGGILSTILTWLLQTRRIDGAVVTGMDPARPWRPRTSIVRTQEEILDAAQSKYVITSVNEILPEIAGFGGRLAYVGLPCQVHSLRKLQVAGDPAVRNIRFVLGPFCGNTLHFTAVRTLLRSYGVSDFRRIRKLRFREGEWPGSMLVELDTGDHYRLPKFHANYLIPFHIMKRCLLCTDLANEFADLSGGDAWSPEYEHRGKGFSLVVCRSEEMDELLSEMETDGILSLTSLEVADAVAMHSHGYDLKKRGAFIRMRFLRALGRPTPEYGYEIERPGLARCLMEAVLDVLFLTLGTRLSRSLVSRVPPRYIGWVFPRLRIWWKKLTHHVKRRGLPETV